MIKTTYTCDRCGHSQETSEQMWGLSIHFGHHGNDSGHKRAGKSPLWCRSCMEVWGILTPEWGKKPKLDPILPPPTLEDLIREIIRTELSS